MSQINQLEIELNKITSILPDNNRLKELFSTLPKSSKEVYELSSIYYVNRQYDELYRDSDTIHRNLVDQLEDCVNNHKIFKTIEIFSNILKSIEGNTNYSFNYLKRLIYAMRKDNKDDKARQEAKIELISIFREYKAKVKENFIRGNLDKRIAEILPYIKKKKNTDRKKRTMDVNQFKYYVTVTDFKYDIQKAIKENLNIYVIDDILFNRLLETVFAHNPIEAISNIIKLKEPQNYVIYEQNRDFKTLKSNYEKALNESVKNEPLEYKWLILELMQYLIKCHKNNVNPDNKEILKDREQIKQSDLSLLNTIVDHASGCNCSIKLDANNKFVFINNQALSKTEEEKCVMYKNRLNQIKSFHNKLFKYYKKLNELFNISKDEEEEEDLIDITPWFKAEKINNLVSLIDQEQLNNLTSEEFNKLKDLLLEKGILWAYISDNIDIQTISKIINNYAKINKTCQIANLDINNLQQLIKQANLYNYANDLLIGLIGIENAAKVISFNQFVPGPITDDVIRLRLRKIIDLAVRSERINKSSLPFNCNTKKGDYTLLRYHNNNPDIFTSGIDTKTCFFVSINENDFFFYSLLSKNGYVVKVVNKEGELIARASCFRRNNVLMINGIRLRNNKMKANNQEETNEMKTIVDLITIMANKMIELTTNDNCPIDYVVCNKAGILESDLFDNRFEKVDSRFFGVPLNTLGESWEKFVHTYDNEDENFFQEVSVDPEKCFTTDFGNHYPAFLIASRNNMGLTSPRDMRYDEEDDIYERPRKPVETYLKDEINSDIIALINRIKALSCFNGTKEEQEQNISNYHLLRNIDDIKDVVLGDDWYIITRNDDSKEIVLANQNNKKSLIEISGYTSIIYDNDGKLKLYKK